MTQPAHALSDVSAQGKKAVLFDRDKTLLLILHRLLQRMGFTVYMASTPQNGMDLIENHQPQLLVWELNKRPDIDFHMLHVVRRHGSSMPYVILISTPTTLNDDAPIEVMQEGDVYMKPFEPAELMRRISWLVKNEKI